MARSTTKNIDAAAHAPFQGRMGPLGPGLAGVRFDRDYDNAYEITWSDALDTTSVAGISVDADSRVRLDHAAMLGAREVMTFNLVANAALGTQTFFIANRPMRIWGISEIHSAAGNDAAAVAAQITHESGTQAPGAGTVVQTNTFDLKGTANTVQNAALLAVQATGAPNAGLVLAIGDRLSFTTTGALTTLAGVQVTVVATPGNKEQVAVYAMNANASIADSEFFTANRPLQIVGVNVIFSAKGSDAGTVSIDVQKDTGTQAVTAGTTVLAAVVNAKGAANTVFSPALSATASVLKMAAGDRLAFVHTGTLTALAGLVIVVYFAPIYNRVEVTYNMQANANIATTAIFVADRDYEFLEGSFTTGTAGTDGGAVAGDFFIDRGTNAPGAGASCLLATASLKATAETPVFVTPTAALHTRLLAAGDRLTMKVSGTLTSLAGLVATASLAPR